jgi:hypothetical protein
MKAQVKILLSTSAGMEPSIKSWFAEPTSRYVSDAVIAVVLVLMSTQFEMARECAAKFL